MLRSTASRALARGGAATKTLSVASRVCGTHDVLRNALKTAVEAADPKDASFMVLADELIKSTDVSDSAAVASTTATLVAATASHPLALAELSPKLRALSPSAAPSPAPEPKPKPEPEPEPEPVVVEEDVIVPPAPKPKKKKVVRVSAAAKVESSAAPSSSPSSSTIEFKDPRAAARAAGIGHHRSKNIPDDVVGDAGGVVRGSGGVASTSTSTSTSASSSSSSSSATEDKKDDTRGSDDKEDSGFQGFAFGWDNDILKGVEKVMEAQQQRRQQESHQEPSPSSSSSSSSRNDDHRRILKETLSADNVEKVLDSLSGSGRGGVSPSGVPNRKLAEFIAGGAEELSKLNGFDQMMLGLEENLKKGGGGCGGRGPPFSEEDMRRAFGGKPIRF